MSGSDRRDSPLSEGMNVAFKGAASSSQSGLKRAASHLTHWLHVCGPEEEGIFRSEMISRLSEGCLPLGFCDSEEIAPPQTLVNLSPEEIILGSLFCGPHGSGKTHNALIVVDGTRRLDPRPTVIWFDFKQSYYHLLAIFGPEQVLVLPFDRIRLNPLEGPVGMSSDKWLPWMIGGFCHATVLGEVSKGVLLRACRSAYAHRNAENLPISLHDVLHSLVALKPTQYKEKIDLDSHNRCIDRLRSILAGTDTFDAYRGVLPQLLEEHRGKILAFDLFNAPDNVGEVIQEYVALFVYVDQVMRGRRGGLDYVMGSDECYAIYGPERRRGWLDISPMEKLARMGREFSIAGLNCSQQYVPLSPALKANTYLLGLTGYSDPAELQALGHAVGLQGEQWEEARQLGLEEIFIRLPKRCPNAVKIWVPALQEAPVSPEQIRQATPDVFASEG